MAYTHGVYVQEKATSIIAPIESDSGIIVVVGTAPINRVKNLKETINTPIVAYSYAEAVEKVGYSNDFESYTICEVIDAAFRKFNVCPIIMINVLDTDNHKTSIAGTTVAIDGKKAVVQQEGILLSSVVVKSNGEGSTTYVENTDYTLGFNDDGCLVVGIIDGGAITTDEISVGYDKLNPEAVTEEDIVGGYDAEKGTYKGMECIGQIYPKLGLIPGQIIAPGYSHKPTVASVMKSKTTKISGQYRCTAIADVDSSVADTYDKINEWKNKNSYVDENLIVCWPKTKIGDTEYHFSTIWATCTAQLDADNGSIPYASPSNKNIPITTMVTESGKEVYLTMDQANLLNGQGICTAINLNGWKSWGNNTSIYPSSTDVKDRYIPVRRFFTWWSNNFILTYFQKVDDPMNVRLIQSIVDSENIKANGYRARGLIAGAKIEYRAEENPETDLLNGTIRFHQMLTPFPPAETIENTLEFDPSTLQSSLTGGA